MSVITVSFKGKSGSGKSRLARLAKEELEKMGFICGPLMTNDAHQRESFVIQDAKRTMDAADKKTV